MSTTELFSFDECPVCLADDEFDDPYLNDDIGSFVFAVPLPPKDVQFGHSAALNMDAQSLSNVIYSDVSAENKKGGQGPKVEFATLSYIVLLLIVLCNAVVCSWHAMKGKNKEAVMGYVSKGYATTKIVETDVSDIDDDDNDEYRTSTDHDVDDFTDDESDDAAVL